MISDRPAYLLADAAYTTLPKAPFSYDWESIPELLRLAMIELGGVQPITKAMADAAGGQLQDKPSKGEIKLFQERGTTFQLVSVVLSLFDCGEIGGVRTFKPFAVTLMPAAKRNAVETANIDAIAKLDVSE
jgi:hypothetical protein